MCWTLYEILLNVFQGFLFTWFVFKMLPKKPNYAPWSFWICSLLTAAALSAYTFVPMPQWDTWIWIFIIVWSFLFFSGSVMLKVFWNMTAVVISGSVVGISYYLFCLIFRTNPDLLLVPGFPRLIFTVSSNLLMWLAFFLVCKLFPEKSSAVRPSFLLLITVIFCVFQIDIYFRLITSYDIPVLWFSIGCIISLAIGVVTIIANRLIIRYEQEKQQYHFLEGMMQEINIRNEEQQELFDSMRELRHDIRSYVSDVRKMVAEGELEQMPVFLDELEKKVQPLYSSGNHALDSVLMVKLTKMQGSGIEFRGSNLHYTGGMNIEDYALCSLVSNMLDNAIEALAARNDQPGERYIYLKFAYMPAGLMMICENPLLGVLPRMQEKTFFTQKSEPYHGLGISIMEKIVHDAGGQLDILVNDTLFQVMALIPPKIQQEACSLTGGDDGDE